LLVRASETGYKDILLQNELVLSEKDFEALDETSAERCEALRIKKANEKPYDNLLLSLSDIVNFGLVDDATTNYLHDGDAGLALANLVNKHDPKTTLNKV
jgi:hypothetical protein